MYEAYGQSKTANIYFASEIDRRYGSAHGLHATSVHPGGIITGLQVNVSEEEKKAFNTPYVQRYMKNAEQGAATTVYAAVSHEWEGKGGKYLSDCVVQGPFKKIDEGPSALFDDGYATWIYDTEKEGRLWKESLRLIGMEDDQ
jgi:hypothetical protein